MCLNCPDKSRVKRKLLCLFRLFKKLKENLQSCGNAFFRLHTTIQENQNNICHQEMGESYHVTLKS